MTTERDIQNQIAFAEAKAEAKGKRAVAINLLKMGLSPEDISKATELSLEEINTLSNS